jgi:integrase
MILTARQAASLLRINENTLSALANTGRIPHTSVPSMNGPQLRFNTFDLAGWLKNGLALNDPVSLEKCQRKFEKQFPDGLAELRVYDRQFVPPARRGKGYCISKVKNKKLGFVYYARYFVDGREIPSRWSTHTNNREAAVEFAVRNRDRIIAEYNRKKTQNKTGSGGLYYIMKNYYARNSQYLKKDMLRGRTLADSTRHSYYNTILNHWIPFLKKRHVKTLDDIDTSLMADFQDCCLAKGNKPQTVNHYVSFVSNIFKYLLIRGHIKSNPCKGLAALKVGKDDQKVTGCYDVNKLKGVFNRRWRNDLSYLLSLVIYTTDMRNSEIERIRVKELITIDKINFIHIPKSKSANGERVVPLHGFVYRKLTAYIRKNKLGPEDFIFKLPARKKLGSGIYKKACLELAEFAGYSADRIEKENIKFYSGRHYWKTLMNSENLGDVEEYFMGHRVTNDVAKRYNHRDKQGRRKIAEKAVEVFKVLDSRLFA